MIGILAMVAWIATLVFAILVAVKMFQRQMVWQGILTIICWLFGLIYGWQKKDELGVGNLMVPFTICFVASVILNVMVRMAATTVAR